MSTREVDLTLDLDDTEYRVAATVWRTPARGPSWASGGEPADGGIDDLLVERCDPRDGEWVEVPIASLPARHQDRIEAACWDAFDEEDA